MAEVSKAVLITGCSSGIGEMTARWLGEQGWTVYATARDALAIKYLSLTGCKPLRLDVTDEESMVAAVRAIEEEHGAVGILINNAGYSQSGALESVPLEAARRQFETNVFGLMRLTQLVLPGMRRQRWGRIVNIGSMGGKLTFPGGGWYHATKHALEALSDALRFEVRGFGIDVTLIEPGLVTTSFPLRVARELEELKRETTYGELAAVDGDGGTTSSVMADGGQGAATSGDGATVATSGDASDGPDAEATSGPAFGGGSADDPYAAFNDAVGAITTEAYDSPLRFLGAPPEKVAFVIERVLKRRRPPTRVVISPSGKITIAARRLLPDRAWDALMRTRFPTPR